MQETSWKKIAGIALLVAVVAGLIIAEWKGLQAIQRMKEEVAALRELVIETNRVAMEGASAAALSADAAAGARKQAEEKSQDAITTAQQATEAAVKANEEVERLHREREQELNRMQEALNRVAETRRTAQGMVVVLPDSTFRFPFDSADLSPKNRELLSRVSGILLASRGYGLSIYGYTDDVGSEDYNQGLSLRRAKAVGDYLVGAGIDSGIVNGKGFGKSRPVAREATPAARAKNRRVEIAITDSSIKFGGEVAPAK